MSNPPSPFTDIPTGFPGLRLLQLRGFTDSRGTFSKTFHSRHFEALGITFQPQEEFYSVSAKNVVRGMHFQVPPAAHRKLVYCARGRVLDVVVDLRAQTPLYGQAFSRELNPANPQVLFIPAGFAHGFLALEDETLMVYQTDVVHTPECDAGIAWDSFGFSWPVREPILSDRDRCFPRLESFASPFKGGL